jgi:hypothetical protein
MEAAIFMTGVLMRLKLTSLCALLFLLTMAGANAQTAYYIPQDQSVAVAALQTAATATSNKTRDAAPIVATRCTPCTYALQAPTITAATTATPIVITSNLTHILNDGDRITVAGSAGMSFDGTYYVKVTGYSTTTAALYTDAALTSGVVGTGTYTASSASFTYAATSANITYRSYHTLSESVSAITLTFPNWYTAAPPGGDKLTGNTLTVRAAIEYPAGSGQLQPLFFRGGQRSCVVENGGSLTSDPFPLNGLPGTGFYVYSNLQPGSGFKFPTGLYLTTTRGEGVVVGYDATDTHTATSGTTTSLTDTANSFPAGVVGGSIVISKGTDAGLILPITARTSATVLAFAATTTAPDATSVYYINPTPVSCHGYSPIIINGLGAAKQIPSVLIWGDSIGQGKGGANSGFDYGFIVQALIGSNPSFPTYPVAYAQTCQPSENGYDFTGPLNVIPGNRFRGAVGNGATDVVWEYGANDVYNGFSLNNMKAATLRALSLAKGSGQKFTVTTVLPRTGSTDSWATATNQTVGTNEAIRTGYNDWLRASGVTLGMTRVIDICTAVEVNASNVLTVDGGRWITTGTANYPTIDGVHPTAAIHTILSASIPATLFRTAPTSTLYANLAGAWKLNANGGACPDGSGNGLDLTANGSFPTSWAPGHFDMATQFTVASSSYLYLPGSIASLQGSGATDLQIAAWVRLDANATDQTLVSKWGAAGLREYELMYSATSGFRFLVSSDGTAFTAVSSASYRTALAGVIPAATWIFVEGRYNHTTGQVSVTVNNQYTDTATFAANTLFTGTAEFDLGKLATGTPYLGGRLASVYVWRRNLTATEEATLWDYGTGQDLPWSH